MDADLIIVGGGLNGLTMALAAHAAGLTPMIVDAAPPRPVGDVFDGRSYALALASCRLLDGLDVWEDVVDHAQPILEIKVSDARDGQPPSPMFLHFDHAEIEEGPMGHLVEDRHLRAALETRVTGDGITWERGATVTAQAPGQVTLADGRVLTARVVIGADGRMSGTASRAGIRHTRWSYDQTALVCALEHDLPHHGIAHQLFLPAGPLAILPLTGNRSSIVWTERAEVAKQLQDGPDEAYLDALRPRFGDFLGDIRLVGARHTYPLGLSLAHHFVAPQVALIGDAAHGVHPIAGQGLNAGLRDIAALAEVLADAARRGEDIASPLVLTRYERWRRFDAVSLALATDTFNRLFSNDNSALRMVRDVGLGIVNRLPGLRRGFIREAAGLTGDVPRLMRGEAL
ncbi:FAD-dependent monooxygenase [Pseudaestuariivita atlantica]|uniref:2-octaprenyl-6-methoxyphenyl hydroxylase n=1 Tax=Pseudaestuariivita atlantica TaxID=1317121 RepID=A0A0L1JP43_9RHOB|nr:2-octaprenyl-6-methoxyphenyl hydroxylase [Pseudaestuariivita atlantica]